MNARQQYAECGITDKILDFAEPTLSALKDRFSSIDAIAEAGTLKVLKAMQDNRVSENHLYGSTGYGYNDDGRDTLEKVYASVFHTEAALVRSQITCGTHALNVALSAILRPGDELLSPVGKPYDTLENVIGIEGRGKGMGSLAEFGIGYTQVNLKPDSSFDYDAIRQNLREKTKMVTIQRSRGYDAMRKTLSVSQIGELIRFIKEIRPDVICMVDNCYGEFVEEIEPGDVGADLTVGSLIKNPGGGLAPMGGYIVGRKDLIEKCAYRLTSPGLGAEVGASLQINPSLYQGLYLAPTVVASALKSAIFASHLYHRMGFETSPGPDEERHDIIQAIRLGSPERIIAFCRGIQAAAPVDAHVRPEPYPMPGYHSDVIMAAGAFIQGSSIELSADAPIEEPYSVYFQGGLTWPHGKLGILKTVQELVDKGLATTG
ncbi:MAG: methionine gamma-lyase family protein [Eubacterium sp.]|nr:methionine gamma-lyase family protein [Eubacterium sp.]